MGKLWDDIDQAYKIIKQAEIDVVSRTTGQVRKVEVMCGMTQVSNNWAKETGLVMPVM